VKSNDTVFKLYGDEYVNKIEIYKDGNSVYEVKVNGAITKNDTYEHYGFICEDMNFDGEEDFGIIVAASSGGEKIRYNCYTYNDISKKFPKNQYLSSLENISFDVTTKQVREMKITKIFDQPVTKYNKTPDYTESRSKIIYGWEDSSLVELSRTSIVYYSVTDIYSYITYTYDSNGKAEEDTEIWLESTEIDAFMQEINW